MSFGKGTNEQSSKQGQPAEKTPRQIERAAQREARKAAGVYREPGESHWNRRGPKQTFGRRSRAQSE